MPREAWKLGLALALMTTALALSPGTAAAGPVDECVGDACASAWNEAGGTGDCEDAQGGYYGEERGVSVRYHSGDSVVRADARHWCHAGSFFGSDYSSDGVHAVAHVAPSGDLPWAYVDASWREDSFGDFSACSYHVLVLTPVPDGGVDVSQPCVAGGPGGLSPLLP